MSVSGIQRVSFVLRRISTDVIPRGTRPDENMLLDFDTRIAVDATQRHAMNLTVMRAAQRRPASTAKHETPSRRRFVSDEALLTRCPCERARLDLRIRGTGPAERLATARAMATSRAPERRIDDIANPSAEAATRQSHGTQLGHGAAPEAVSHGPARQAGSSCGRAEPRPRHERWTDVRAIVPGRLGGACERPGSGAPSPHRRAKVPRRSPPM